MGYLIKYDDIRYVREKSDPDIGKAVETLTKLKKKIEELNSAQSFRGESAESIKKYMQEVHFSIIGSIIGLLQLYSSKLLLYCDDYYQYDSDKHAVIPEDVIDFLLNDVPKRIKNFESCCSYFSDDVRSISDLFDPNNPDISSIEREMKYIDEELISYDSGVKYQESSYKNISDMETLLNSINTSINEYDSKARNRSLTYEQGDYFKSENTASLFNNYKVSMEYFNQRNFAGKLEAANNHQAAVYKEIQTELEAQQKKQQAVWQIVSGTLLVVGGILCIVFTAGAAAPLIATQGVVVFGAVMAVPVVAGTGTVLFGGADIVSGVQTIQHNGDASYKTLNDSIIKNVFNGSEKKYNIYKQAFAFTSSACIPIAGAYSASTLTLRSATTILAKEVAGVGTGYATDWLSKKAGLNQSQSMILGMITSFGTSKGLNSLDKKFNVSGFKKTPTPPKVSGEGEINSIDDIIRDGSQLENGKLRPNIKYKAGEYDYLYETDEMGRISKFETDELQLTNRDERLPHNPDTPGKLEGDHAGHLAGDRFGGSPELDNLVSQSSNVNLSQYKKIENQWAKAIEQGKKVKVNVEVKYEGNILRPSEFNVKFEIDGKRYRQSILN